LSSRVSVGTVQCRFAVFKKHLVALLKKRQQAMQIRVRMSDYSVSGCE